MTDTTSACPEALSCPPGPVIDAVSALMREFDVRSGAAVRRHLPANWGVAVLWDEVDGDLTTNKMVAASVHRRLLTAAQTRAEAAEAQLTELDRELGVLMNQWAAREQVINTDADWGKHPSGIVERNTLGFCRRQLADLLEARAAAPVYCEIVDPSGKVAYRRRSDHPDVLEALRRPGYSVRRAEGGAP